MIFNKIIQTKLETLEKRLKLAFNAFLILSVLMIVFFLTNLSGLGIFSLALLLATGFIIIIMFQQRNTLIILKEVREK